MRREIDEGAAADIVVLARRNEWSNEYIARALGVPVHLVERWVRKRIHELETARGRSV
jgi:DNA-directed RNA polymerase specialized sigma24 family protein